MKKKMKMESSSSDKREVFILIVYAIAFYSFVIQRSLRLSTDYHSQLYGLRSTSAWLSKFTHRSNDVSDAQWRNFRANLPILTIVFAIFGLAANAFRACFRFKARGMSFLWLFLSFIYLTYLHGACIVFILAIALLNYLLVKIFARKKYFLLLLWSFNIFFLICNRVYEGYSFSIIGQQWAYLDNFRGTFRWHICFNFVVLRMISFGYDYHWADQDSRFDQEERSVQDDKYSLSIYICYLVYAPLYLAGPIISFNAFASQVLIFMWLKFFLIWRYFRFWSLICGIEAPENMPRCINNCHNLEGFWKNWHASYNKWLVRYMYIPLGGSQKKLLNCIINSTRFLLFELLKIVVLSIMFSENSLISLLSNANFLQLDVPQNNYSVRDVTWYGLRWVFSLLLMELMTHLFHYNAFAISGLWKQLSPMHVFIIGYGVRGESYYVESALGQFVFRELSAVAGAVTITCLMVANLVGYVIGPSGINWLVSQFLQKEGLPVLGGMFVTFYVGTKPPVRISPLSKPKPVRSSAPPCSTAYLNQYNQSPMAQSSFIKSSSFHSEINILIKNVPSMGRVGRGWHFEETYHTPGLNRKPAFH
ncbi:putative membrane-bound o-acyltransferase c24h6.01c [Quercus suber]|uniref:Membrane-bound o-acyltransferase c24h6.01c n=1 Tax=Quercus suber TaxID=58331 RepID=A0AAW0KIS7_QUESU